MRIYHSEIISTVNKKRYTFVYEKQYFKLDLFDDLSVLEVTCMEGNKNLVFPTGINIIKEVTDDINYQNIKLGSSIYNKSLKKVNN